MNDLATIQTNDPETAFRGKAASVFHAAADMTLHELVDEFVRLGQVIADGTIKPTEEYKSVEYTPEAQVALKERQIVNAASRARFGVGFSEYDDF